MDRPCRLGSPRADADRPRARFLRPGGEEGLQPEELVRGSDEDVESWLGETHLSKEFTPLVGRKLRDLRLELATDDHDAAMFFLCDRSNDFDIRRFTCEVALGNVGDEEYGLDGDQIELAQRELLIVREIDSAQRHSLVHR